MKQKYRIRPDYEFLVIVECIGHITAAPLLIHIILTVTGTAEVAGLLAPRNTRTVVLKDQAAYR